MDFIKKNEWTRKVFNKLKPVEAPPSLIDLQVESFKNFLQQDVSPQNRQDIGLQSVFNSVFPIHDLNKTAVLEFVSYNIEKPKYSIKECREQGLSYESSIKALLRLVIFEPDQDEKKIVASVKEQELYLGTIPIMLSNGSFVFNGTERVIVSQLHRSPGIIFEHDSGKTHSSGKLLYSARIIPHRGSWLDFEFDQKNVLFARIDRKRKLHGTVILKALGYSVQDILEKFYPTEKIFFKKGNFLKSFNLDLLEGVRLFADLLDEKGKVLIKKGKKVNKALIESLKNDKHTSFLLQEDELYEKISMKNIVIGKETVLEANKVLTQDIIEKIRNGLEVDVLYIDDLFYGDQVHSTLSLDKTDNTEQALLKVFERLRPGEPPTVEAAQQVLNFSFFDPTRYDLSKVGRMKINYKFGLKIPVTETVLTKEDILMTVKYLVDLSNGKGSVDDIDHLGNRRVRSVGELLENQLRIALVRMERMAKERMTSLELDTMMPHDLINQKPMVAIIKEFFGTSQLSQFMDQTNPLAEITHKRRLSALGPGGLTRERAGFEVRDVHPTHYGRMCPVETPEGPNIGLITSLATYAKVSEYGFIESPYQEVKNGVIQKEVKYYSAFEEEEKVIAQINPTFSENNKIEGELIPSRRRGDFSLLPASEINLIDVSPIQMISISTSLIPFLEHDDANRALMGSNMMRQAVPLVKGDAPFVGTGIENVVARDVGAVVVAKNSGKVIFVDSTKIVVQQENSGFVDIYKLIKYTRTNQNTCLNQTALVKEGDLVLKNEVIADGASTHFGDLSLGQNVLVAFMPWNGYNYDDSILISEKLLAEDIFTSIHIERLEIEARDTKLGKEEITRDLPINDKNLLKDLDESGIIRIGTQIKPGDVLVGRVTPKAEIQLSPEQKLLKAIFGDKAKDVKDTSLRSSVSGTVIDVHVFTRQGISLDSRSKEIIAKETELLKRDEEIQLKSLREVACLKISEFLENVKIIDDLVSEDGEKTLLKKGTILSLEVLKKIPFDLIGYLPLKEKDEEKFLEYYSNIKNTMQSIIQITEQSMQKLYAGHELPLGVLKKVVVHVAIKRKLQAGDKMAGRHGNKGVISKVVPKEDMPFLSDGTPVDVILTPLGVPSRMNIGQLFELHLGWAARGLGEKIQVMLEEQKKIHELKNFISKIYEDSRVDDFLKKASDAEVINLANKLKTGVRFSATPFSGAKEIDIERMLKLADLPVDGKSLLFDGVTGEVFSEDVTVGSMYILKLHHLVDEKIHARSIGPYSLITQQPLGGKAQFGGQRLGEMEVWALEAYGAANTLQEFLTVKSDDTVGRNRMYESIVKGENILEPGIPESFNVLIKELQSLAIDFQLEEEEGVL